jgi:hypothetical protein
MRSLRERDTRIKELEQQLVDKEAQRRELASYIYKPNRIPGEPKPAGKKPGAPGFHRPQPKEEEVTTTQTFPLEYLKVHLKGEARHEYLIPCVFFPGLKTDAVLSRELFFDRYRIVFEQYRFQFQLTPRV